MAYEPREIDSTKGLPAFDQLVAAARTRNVLGPALQAGTEGYAQQKEFNLKSAIAQAEAKKNEAEAGYYGRKDSLVDPNTLDPDMQKQVASSIQIDPVTGQRGVPVSTAIAALSQSKLAQKTDYESQLVDEKKRSLVISQQLADEKAAHNQDLINLGIKAQKREALQTVASSTPKDLTMTDVLVGKAAEAVNKVTKGLTPTSPQYEAYKQGTAAKTELSNMGGVPPSYPLGGPTNAPPNPIAPTTPNGIPHRDYPLSPTQTVTPASPSPTNQGLTNPAQSAQEQGLSGVNTNPQAPGTGQTGFQNQPMTPSPATGNVENYRDEADALAHGHKIGDHVTIQGQGFTLAPNQ